MDYFLFSFTQFQLECLKAHNDYRARHRAPPLKLNKNICNYAQQWANYLASCNRMEHRSKNAYGENIYMSWSSNKNATVDGQAPVKSWYDEVKMYSYGRPGFTMNTGHFTQVVWVSSREMGVGIARSPSGSVYVVANYDPPGNFQGRFNENVLRG